jgi:hypothetical protein
MISLLLTIILLGFKLSGLYDSGYLFINFSLFLSLINYFQSELVILFKEGLISYFNRSEYLSNLNRRFFILGFEDESKINISSQINEMNGDSSRNGSENSHRGPPGDLLDLINTMIDDIPRASVASVVNRFLTINHLLTPLTRLGTRLDILQSIYENPLLPQPLADALINNHQTRNLIHDAINRGTGYPPIPGESPMTKAPFPRKPSKGN